MEKDNVMSKKSLIIFLSLLVIFCIMGSFAYYRKVFSGTIIGNIGSAIFNVSGFTEVDQSKIITLKDGLIVPGDKGSFDIVMDASGSSVDMYASLRIERTNLPENLKFYTSSDYKSELHTYYSYLKAESNTVTIYWYWNPYIDDTKDSEFISSGNSVNLDASIIISAVQVSASSNMKNGASDKTDFWSDTYRPYIKTISFEKNINNLPVTCNADNLCFDISTEDSQRKVYAYLKDSGDRSSSNTLYNLYIASEVPIFAPTNCDGLFENFINLVTIDFNDNFNTSKVTSMNNMFKNDTSIVSLDLNSLNTGNVLSMSSMFYGCANVSTLYINNFNTVNVTNMESLFKGCSKLVTIDLSGFNTSKLTSMNQMFDGCNLITNLDLSSFDTANINNMVGIFQNCSSLTELNLINFNTSNVINMENMFYGCSSLTNLDISNFNTSKVTSMKNMFYGCSSLIELDLSKFNTSNVTNMEYMFYNCSKVQTEINIMSSNITYTNMFVNASLDSNAKIIVNYISDASTLVNNMIATKSSSSNVVKGNQI